MTRPTEYQSAEELRHKANELRLKIISNRIADLLKKYGTYRAMSKKLGIDSGYLCSLRTGKKTSPSESVLKKLGLK